MLYITVPPFEMFDESTERYITVDKETTLEMENSLYAISLWEQKFNKPYFPKKDPAKLFKKEQEQEPEKTPDEMLYFFKCMVVGVRDPDRDVDENVFLGFTEENYKDLYEYLQSPRSAYKSSPSNDKSKKGNNRTLVSEVFYAWMSELQIPWEAQYWNINRLLNVIQIVNEDNEPPDKKKKKKAYDRMKEWDEINRQRQKALGTKG